MTLSLFLELHSRQRRGAPHTYHYPAWSGGRDQPGSYFQLSTGPLVHQSHFKDPSLLSFPWNYCLPAAVEPELPALLLLNNLNILAFFFLQHKTSKNVHLLERFPTKADVSLCCSVWRSKRGPFCFQTVYLSTNTLLVARFWAFVSDSGGADVLLSLSHSNLWLEIQSVHLEKQEEEPSCFQDS